MGAWNIFRIMGDLSHLASKCILILSIHRNRSAEGVSFITQALYALVFCTRYLDLLRETSAWNAIFKVVYISTSLYILAVMQWTFPRSREREISWKLGAVILAGSAALSPFAMLFEKRWAFLTWMWVFSEILESVCVLPQLLLLRQTSIPTVINSFYLVTLGSYRALYCLNWFLRELDPADRKPDVVSVLFGLVQTTLYVDFAWVYYTRQRVKLRAGGIVDADDMRRGWLLRRIFGKHVDAADDEETGPAIGGRPAPGGASHGRSKWGPRGISVSADHDVLPSSDRQPGGGRRAAGDIEGDVDPDARMHDPDDLARALDDDDDDDDNDAEDTPLRRGDGSPPHPVPGELRSGAEWRE